MQMMTILNYLKRDEIANPPYGYDFLINLEEREFPKYLAKIYKYRTGEKLPLKFDFKNRNWVIDKNKCKTFNKKIQWLKLYGITDLMRKCTDKVAVRDYVVSQVGIEYLKSVLQICNTFDEIEFNKLPNSFVIKCNHGSKWHFIIKNKQEYLSQEKLFEVTKRYITGWLEQEYYICNGFELQYRGIKPQIIIEKLLRDNINYNPKEIQIYCFNGIPEYIVKIHNEQEYSFWNKDLNPIESIFKYRLINIKETIDDNVKTAVKLSEKLSEKFKFVRVDWLIYNKKIYFNELTFTPYSGFYKFIDINKDLITQI